MADRKKTTDNDNLDNSSSTSISSLWDGLRHIRERNGALHIGDNSCYIAYRLCSAYMERLQKELNEPQDKPFNSHQLDEEVLRRTSESLRQMPRLPAYPEGLLPEEDDQHIMLFDIKDNIQLTRPAFEQAIKLAQAGGTSLLKNVCVAFLCPREPQFTFIVSMRLVPAGHRRAAARLFFPLVEESAYSRKYVCREKCGCTLDDLFNSVPRYREGRNFSIYTYGLAAEAHGKGHALVGHAMQSYEPLPILWDKVALGTISQYDISGGESACVLIACEAAFFLLNYPALFPTAEDINEIIKQGVSEFVHSKRELRTADHFAIEDAQELTRYKHALKFSMKQQVCVDPDLAVTRKTFMALLERNVGKALVLISQLKSFCVFVVDEKRVYYVDSHPRGELHVSFEKGFALQFSSYSKAADFLLSAYPHTPCNYLMNLFQYTVVELNKARLPVSENDRALNHALALDRYDSREIKDECTLKVESTSGDDVVMDNLLSASQKNDNDALAYEYGDVARAKSCHIQIDSDSKVAHEFIKPVLAEGQKNLAKRAVEPSQRHKCCTPHCERVSKNDCARCQNESCDRCLVYTIDSCIKPNEIAYQYCWECASRMVALKDCSAGDTERIKRALRKWEKDIRDEHAIHTRIRLEAHRACIQWQIESLTNAFTQTFQGQELDVYMPYIEKQCLLDDIEMRERASKNLIGSLTMLVKDLESNMGREYHLPPSPPPPVWALPGGEE